MFAIWTRSHFLSGKYSNYQTLKKFATVLFYHGAIVEKHCYKSSVSISVLSDLGQSISNFLYSQVLN